MASEITLSVRLDWNDHYNQLNWFKPSKPPQLLPKDLLRYSRKISGDEVNKHISKVADVESVTETIGGTINLLNGDSLQINPGDLLLSASSNAQVTNIQQIRNPLNRSIETTVTYVTYDAVIASQG